MQIRIGLIGEYSELSPAHAAIPPVLKDVAESKGYECEVEWLSTDTLPEEQLVACDGLWCVPGSSYKDMEGAVRAISYARRLKVPFLGTCGGFQHAILEFSRAIGITDASHAEFNPEGSHVIVPLSCSLFDVEATIEIDPESHLFSIWGEERSVEEYRCRYGISDIFLSRLLDAGLIVSARGPEGEVRAIELREHPFFIAMLFQPERQYLKGKVHPVIRSYIEAVIQRRSV